MNELQRKIKNQNIDGTIWSSFENIFHHHFFTQFLQWQLNDMIRGKKIITIASIEILNSHEGAIKHKTIEAFAKIIKNQVRTNDFVFCSEQQGKFLVLLPYSGIREVQFLIKRVEEKFNNEFSQFNPNYCLVKGLVEITDGNFSVENILNEVDYVHSVATKNDQFIEQKVLKNNEFIEPLKVAIVDSSELSHTVLKNCLIGLAIPQTTFEISHYDMS